MMEWRVVYDDGKIFNQHTEDGSENKYTDIDRSKLSEFHLTKNGQSVVVLHLDKKKKLVYRRRVAQHFSGPRAGTKEVVYLAGWRHARGLLNKLNRLFQIIVRHDTSMITEGCLCFVFEDANGLINHLEVVNRFQEDHPWFYSPTFRPEEQP